MTINRSGGAEIPGQRVLNDEVDIPMIWVPALIVLAIVIATVVGSRLKIPIGLSIFVGVWHTLFCFIYYFYTLENAADAKAYYLKAVTSGAEFGLGTGFIVAVTSVLTGLGMNYLSTFLVYNIFGIIGVILLLYCLLSLWPRRIAASISVPVVVALAPTLNFWSSALGKDAPAFLSVCLICYASLDFGGRKLWTVLGIAIMLVVRPHVAAIMVLSIGLALVSARKGVAGPQRIVLLVLGLALSVALLPIASNYVGIGDDISVNSVMDTIEKRQGYNISGGSSVDIASMPFYLRAFTYLFRPLFVDAGGAMGLIVSLENSLLLLLFLRYIGICVANEFFNSSFTSRFNAIFFLIMLLMLSSTTANLGIAIRQKTMLLPSLFVWMAWSLNSVDVRVKRQQRHRRVGNAAF